MTVANDNAEPSIAPEPRTIANGIYFDLPREQYDRLTGRVNYSTLKQLEQSPFHYRHAVDLLLAGPAEVDKEQSDTLLRGEATHVLALEPDLYGGEDAENPPVLDPGKLSPAPGRFLVFRGTRDERHARYQGVLAKAALGRQKIITAAMDEHAKSVARAIRTSPSAAPFIIGGKREVTVCWDYEEPQLGALDGWTVPMRCRLDYLTDAAILDLKNAKSAKAEKFARQAWELGYFAQAAMQLDGVAAVTRRVRPYLWLVIESQSPYACAVYGPSKLGLELGRKQYQQWLRTRHVCIERNDWPSYTVGPMELDPPHYALPKDEVDEL